MPIGKGDLEIGKEAPVFFNEEELDNHTFYSNDKNIILNFWSVSDPQSRIRNRELAQLVSSAENNDKILVSICVSEEKTLQEEILRIDGISSKNVISKNVDEIDANLYKDFQLESGLRSFLIDRHGILRKITPTKDDIISFS